MFKTDWDKTPPVNLLSKLLIFARTPDEDDPQAPLNDKAWCLAEVVSTYRQGWNKLADEGYVELDSIPDPADPENLAATMLVVRLTDKGLQYALEANLSPTAIRAEEQAAAEAAVQRYKGSDGFGEF